jgi:alpha-1,2-mannosyltransferase
VADVVIGRALTLAAGLMLLGPPVTVGAIGLGVPEALAWVVPIGLAMVAIWIGRVPPVPLDQARRHPVAVALWMAVLAVAVTFSIRTSLFAHYPDAPRFSVAPGDRFREEHLCMTAYAEAARLLGVAGANVYDPELYRPGGVPRRIGRFTVDYYHYPPPFLLLPTALRGLAPDFFDFRRVWFAQQTIAVVGLWLGIAWWVGGTTGRRFAFAGIGLMALPVTWAALQVGNAQTTVIAVALAGAMAVASGRSAAGAALLTAATLGKIFPGVLLAHVVAWHRPRVAGWVLASGAGILVVTAVAFGPGVFSEFALGELPRMLSGDAFLQTETQWAAPVNQSIYGFTVKLRQLGVDVLDRETGKMVTRGLVALLGLAVLAVGWRLVRQARIDSDDARLAALAVMFGFLNLASFISPFVGGAYGAVYTIWLATLLAVSTFPTKIRAGYAVAAVLLFATTALTSSPRFGVAPSTSTMVVSTAGSVLLFGINIAAVWTGAAALVRAEGVSRRTA